MSSYPNSNQPMPTNRSAQPADSLPYISIIVPIYNGAHIIGRLIDSIQQVDYPADRYEILVVDNNSTDALAGALAPYSVRLLHEREIQSSYAARNLGIRQASGEILAFTDADCRVHPQWLRCLQTPFQDPLVGGVAGAIYGVEPGETWVEEVLNRRNHMSMVNQRGGTGAQSKLKLSFTRPTRRFPRLLKQLGLVTYRYDPRLPSVPIAPTANVAYRRQAFEQCGHFDDTNHGAGDLEFPIRMQQQSDFKLVAAPDAIIYHRHRTSLRQLWQVFARYEVGNIMLLDTFLGLDSRVKRQLIVESLAYLLIGVPWASAKVVYRALRSVLLGSPDPFYTKEMIVDLVTLTSRHFTRIKASRLLYQGRIGKLWIQ